MHSLGVKQNYLVTHHQSNVAVYAVPAFSDNYLWLIVWQDNCLIVDPGDASAVTSALDSLQIVPSGILVTHKHHDHIGGVDRLMERFGIPAFAPQGISGCKPSRLVADGESLQFGKLSFRAIAVPGHTLEHIAWYCEQANPPMVFVGDTLFGGGCGRMFEGTAQQFWQSISRLMELPDSTKVYCAHEYTRANLSFALRVEPNNQKLIERAAEANRHTRSTVPFELALEKATNPFCRVEQISLARAQWSGLKHSEVFGKLRAMKDVF